jgi:hypothetical protein
MNAAKLVRFAAVLTVLAGYAFIFRAGEARIGAQLARNALVAERIAAAERTLASQHLFATERARLRAALRTVKLNGERGAQVASFVRYAAGVATAHRTRIGSITTAGSQIPARTAALSRSPEPLSATDPLDTILLEVTIEGAYADVLSTIRGFSRTAVLASVDVASVARKNVDAGEPTVTAALRVVLHRLAAERPSATGSTQPPAAAPTVDVRTQPN